MQKKIVANNPTARHNYTIEDTIEAGIVLTGTEIKSIRKGKVNLKDSYANIKKGEVFIYGMHISPYEHGNIFNKDPLRSRKLLLNRREINKLTGLIKQKGLTLVPISLYFNGNFLKIELGQTDKTAMVFLQIVFIALVGVFGEDKDALAFPKDINAAAQRMPQAYIAIGGNQFRPLVDHARDHRKGRGDQKGPRFAIAQLLAVKNMVETAIK